MNILLTNDDGPFGPGLPELALALRKLGEVTVVCPAEERSGVGHAITYLVPVHTGSVRLAGGVEITTLTGTPADCVKFALTRVFDSPPGLVISGPNPGINAGVDLFYSGTVAAAIEGGFCGVRSIAMSTSRANAARPADVAAQAVRVIRLLADEEGDGPVVFNVNIPRLGDTEPEVRFTRQALVFPRGSYRAGRGPRDREHFWLDSSAYEDEFPPDSDVAAVQAGCVSVTPLRLNLTDDAALARLAGRVVTT